MATSFPSFQPTSLKALGKAALPCRGQVRLLLDNFDGDALGADITAGRGRVDEAADLGIDHGRWFQNGRTHQGQAKGLGQHRSAHGVPHRETRSPANVAQRFR